MNHATKFWKFFAIFIAVSGHVQAQENDAWAKANQEYGTGNFREAAETYEGVARAGQTSAAVFYNIGNAHFRAGELGLAILNYERALALEPQDPEAIANLRLAREKARALELKKSWADQWLGTVTAKQCAIAAAVGFWAALFALTGWLLTQRNSKILASVFVLALLAAAAAIYALYSLETGPSGRSLAIVTATSTDARLATADSAGTVLTLPPGSEIKILSVRGDWLYAALPNDLRGWIPAQNAERVRLD
ncbi:MAG: tetratricopeptide repeat protein [Verrucomicrobiota bacterium]|nr:tetratricopeptide repeat protein [Verrucomicrobiota bacterium]